MSTEPVEPPETRVVKDLLFAAAPERGEEFSRLWDTYAPSFQAASDKPGFHLGAGVANLVVFTSRSMRQLWLLGFAGIAAMKALSGAVFYLLNTRQPFDREHLGSLPGQAEADAEFDKIAESARALGELEDASAFDWPPSVPEPESGRPAENMGALAFDLTCMATAYTFLHEVKHVLLKQQGISLHGPDEELACDAYASDMLLAQVASYAERNKVPVALVRRKRAMAIALASFFLLSITPPNSWSGTDSHPALRVRLEALIGTVDPNGDDDFWIFVCCLVASLLRREGRMPTRIPFGSPRELGLALIAAM